MCSFKHFINLSVINMQLHYIIMWIMCLYVTETTSLPTLQFPQLFTLYSQGSFFLLMRATYWSRLIWKKKCLVSLTFPFGAFQHQAINSVQINRYCLKRKLSFGNEFNNIHLVQKAPVVNGRLTVFFPSQDVS